MKKIVTFGEILLRLTPPGYLKLSQSNQLSMSFGGSETNVAVSLAHMGRRSEFVTKLPENDIAGAAIADLRSHDVEVDHIVKGGERLGLYFYENTSSVRASKVVYDRSNSSFATSVKDDYDWDAVFVDAEWFHWSGIGPALSQSAADVTLDAINKASAAGLTISADLNYRKNLWKYGKAPEEIMPVLANKCDILFGTEGEYEKTFGVKAVPFTIKSDKEAYDIEAHRRFCADVMAKAHNCKMMFVALRNVIDAKHHVFQGLLYTASGDFYTSRIYYIDHVVDCVGCGDAFAAGMIYGVKEYADDNQKALEYATAAAILKNTIEGDYNLSSSADVKALMGGDASGAVSR
ncbi:MAG: sugar kinase [Bacteroidales bacterium]|nr:sugar kinase [Bacteroidales bacterium]